MATRKKNSTEYTDLGAVEKLEVLERELRAMLDDSTMKQYVRLAVLAQLVKVAREVDAITPKGVERAAEDDPIEAIRLRAIR